MVRKLRGACPSTEWRERLINSLKRIMNCTMWEIFGWVPQQDFRLSINSCHDPKSYSKNLSLISKIYLNKG